MFTSTKKGVTTSIDYNQTHGRTFYSIHGTALFSLSNQNKPTIFFYGAYYDVLQLDKDNTQQIVSWETLQYHRVGVVEG